MKAISRKRFPFTMTLHRRNYCLVTVRRLARKACLQSTAVSRKSVKKWVWNRLNGWVSPWNLKRIYSIAVRKLFTIRQIFGKSSGCLNPRRLSSMSLRRFFRRISRAKMLRRGSPTHSSPNSGEKRYERRKKDCLKSTIHSSTKTSEECGLLRWKARDVEHARRRLHSLSKSFKPGPLMNLWPDSWSAILAESHGEIDF